MAIERTATSPVGETIPLMPDAKWAEKAGVNPKSVKVWKAGYKRFVIAALWEHGPFVDEAHGLAVRMLCDYVEANYGLSITPGAVTTMMADGVNAPAFQKVAKNSKRTSSVRLVAMPETWYFNLQETIRTELPTLRPKRVVDPPAAPTDPEPVNGHQAAPQTAPVAVLDEPTTPSDAEWEALTRELDIDAPTVYDTQPAIELEIAQSVAMSLLTTVVEIIHAGTPEQTDARVRQLTNDLMGVQEKLGKRLEENQTMRRQLRETGDLLIAVRKERDGLRSRLHAAEANLQRAMNSDTQLIINAEVQKRIDQFMRSKPANPKEKDS